MESNLSVNRVLDVLIKRLNEEVHKPKQTMPGNPERYFNQGFRHAVMRVEAFRRALHKRYPQLQPGKD